MNTNKEINPFDILSGKVVQNSIGTFWFKKAGVNVIDEYPIFKRLHRLDGPASIYADGTVNWVKNGKMHRVGGPAVFTAHDNMYYFYLNGVSFETEEKYKKAIEYAKRKNKPA